MYIEETYTDKYKSLYQVIRINTFLDKMSNGMHSKELRAKINPNLDILIRKTYLNENFEQINDSVIKIEEK